MRRQSSYKDTPGLPNPFPKAKYLSDIAKLIGALALLYEPRRGGVSSTSGGRSAFTGFAFIDKVWDDPNDSTPRYLSSRYFTEFIRVVSISHTSFSLQSLQRAVRSIEYEATEEVTHLGLFIEFPLNASRQGLAEIKELNSIFKREAYEFITNRLVRDATFRYGVVEETYDGHCALTGIRMANGNGCAEADAAHIQPVAECGPDSTRNGLALMKRIHWTFDGGLLSLTDDGRILTVNRDIDGSLLRILPSDMHAKISRHEEKRPHPVFLQWHRGNIFKDGNSME